MVATTENEIELVTRTIDGLQSHLGDLNQITVAITIFGGDIITGQLQAVNSDTIILTSDEEEITVLIDTIKSIHHSPLF